MTQRAEVTYAVYSAENPASRPKIRKTPIRSWLPSVVRWRLIASLARVIAVEKPMQYSVPWTSLSIVLGIATQRHAGVDQDLRVRQRVVAADGDEDVDAERRAGCRGPAASGRRRRRRPRSGPARPRPSRAAGRPRASCAGSSARCAGSCRRSARSSGCWSGRAVAGSRDRARVPGRTWVRPSQPRRMPRTSCSRPRSRGRRRS